MIITCLKYSESLLNGKNLINRSEFLGMIMTRLNYPESISSESNGISHPITRKMITKCPKSILNERSRINYPGTRRMVMIRLKCSESIWNERNGNNNSLTLGMIMIRFKCLKKKKILNEKRSIFRKFLEWKWYVWNVQKVSEMKIMTSIVWKLLGW